MKNILILCLLMIGSQAFAQTAIVGGSGVCHVDGDPDLSDTLESQDSRFECQIAIDTSDAVIYVYNPSGTIGDRWDIFSTDTRVDTAYILTDTLRLVVRQVNDLSVVKTLKVAIPIPPTDLTFTGATSPITLNSSTGSDVSFKDSTGIAIKQVGQTLTILNTGPSGTGLANRLPVWFSSGYLGYESSFRIDSVNNRLMIGDQSAPTATFHVIGEGVTPSTFSVKVSNDTINNIFNIRDDSRIGIGTTSPTAVLDIRPPVVNGQTTLRLRSKNNIGIISNHDVIQITPNNSTSIYGSIDYLGRWNCNPGVFSSFGYTNRDATIHVGTRLAGAAGIIIRGSTSQSQPLLEWQKQDATVYGVITGDGKVGIGISSPLALLQIKGVGTTPGNYDLIVTNSGGVTTTASLVVRGDGLIGIGTNAPTQELTVVGDVTTNHIQGRGSAPTVTVNTTTCGTGATASVVGFDLGFVVTVTFGTTPSAVGGELFTLNYNTALPGVGIPVMFPGDDSGFAADLVKIAGAYTANADTTDFQLWSNGNLSTFDSDVLKFNFIVVCR